jgi:hypothetical protein
MKKICIALFMAGALTVSVSTFAQDNKKEGTCCKAKSEQTEKKSGETKACCAEKKDQTADATKKEGKTCCAEKSTKAKSSTNKDATAMETKSCGKKK